MRLPALLLPLLAVLAAGLAGCSKENAPKQSGPVTPEQLSKLVLRVGAPNKIGNRPYLEVSGELEKLPYKVQWVEFSATPALLEALRNDAIDLGGNGGATGLIFEAGNNGAGAIKVAAAGRSAATNNPAAALIVRRDSPLRSFSDLKGARVSVMQGTGTQYILQRKLEASGFRRGDVDLVHLANDLAVPALVSGHIDVLGIWEPQASVLLKRPDLRLLEWTGKSSDSYTIQYASATALADPVRRAAIADFLQRLARSTIWVSDHPDAFAKAMSKLAGIDPDVALAITRKTKTRYGLDEAEQQKLKAAFGEEAAFWRKQGVLRKDVPVDALFDFSFDPAIRKAAQGQ